MGRLESRGMMRSTTKGQLLFTSYLVGLKAKPNFSRPSLNLQYRCKDQNAPEGK